MFPLDKQSLTLGLWHKYLSNDTLWSCLNSLSHVFNAETEGGSTIYPPRDLIFSALQKTPPEKVRCVIVGQDPYHGPGQANGLAFSVNPGVALPPSLKNIFKELNSDLGISMPQSGDLSAWAEQGVLLLNTVLTVEEGKPNSCSGWGWQNFVADILEVCAELPQPIVFLLWGRHAQGFVQRLNLSERPNKVCLCSSHPSPLGARKPCGDTPAFLGSKPFSGVNTVLERLGREPIDWSL